MKKWLKDLFASKKRMQDDNGFPIVWDKSLISIYQFLLPYKDADKLPDTAQNLPDESHDDSKIKWAAGAMDGVMNHHSSSSEQACAEQILTLLRTITAQPTQQDIAKLYTLIKEQGTLSYIDELTEKMAKAEVNFNKLYEFVYWLLLNSPDREVIKFSIAMLGRFNTQQTELFLLFGMHEEFTLYSAVALQNTLSSPIEVENALLTLAKKVDGWGRIHLVERLAKNPSQEVKNWLLREGYKNSVMYEYLAYTCATAGDLQTALAQPSVDMALLVATGEMIEALIMGGPAEDMRDYDQGASVCLCYLAQLQKQPINDLNILRTLLAIRDFIVDEVDDSYPNWDQKIKITLTDTVNNLITQEHWLPLIQQSLQTNDKKQFGIAINLYDRLGFDAWPLRFEHQKYNDSSQWYNLMQTDDAQRVQETIQLAKQKYDFFSIATGPELVTGFGTTFQEHYVLDFILQDLHRFPGVGEDLIVVGLNSPVIRSRNLALNAIESWDRQLWSPELKHALKRLAKIEPNEDTKQRVMALLNSLGA
ncbi:hypothetical protein GCM10023211_21890 [Orbus sasakiae]|uniref:Uncharacterized protein n=1 Tax=Orbus sasakiae TaxID=1078475 RepID=A0ABP9NB11_9GAMM